MADEKEVSITIHGLPVDNGNVRAEIFLNQFKALIGSIKIADAHVNGKAAHQLIIVDLAIGSAQAKIREKIKLRRILPAGATSYVGDAMRCIYNGDASIVKFPAEMIESLAPIVRGVNKKFSHTEVQFGENNVVRIDDYFARQMANAIRTIRGEEVPSKEFFKGISLGEFDGAIKEIDARGSLVRGKLILTAGGKELDCIFSRGEIDKLRVNFERRAKITAIAHFDGESLLPVRLDVRGIAPIIENPDLIRWRGAFGRPRQSKSGAR